ncbi:exonuclease SbcCD subunit D [Halomonas sp. THAF12]|uniref:exonuclease SbcCD subunit D n=1 Tax=Halomonas sp. B23F22_10 TaxID=3459515 RepID=UPI00373E5531
MLRLIHTADWHLGQSFHGQERHEEHQAFLAWLLDTLVEREADALLVAGDIFDVVNPSLRAQELLYDFIVSAHERLPGLDIVLIAGNHDSGNRIELPAPLMQRLRTHARGRVSWLDDGRLDAERLLVPLTDAAGETRAWCLALPFLRPAEVTGGLARGEADDSDDSPRNDYVDGIARVHEQLIAAARERREPGQALVAMSHAHLRGAAVSEASERPIVIGGEESISAALFPDDITYVALGHLHRAQQVGEERIRYSGSPLPLDFSEVNYPHQVVEATLDGEKLTGVEAIPVPRPVAMHRLGPASLDEVLAELEALEMDADLPGQDRGRNLSKERWPWLEVRVELEAPMPDLRARVDAALAGKPLRLLRLERRLPAVAAEDAPERVDLETLGPRRLFERTWQARWGEPPDEDVLADFDRLRQDVLDDDGEASA